MNLKHFILVLAILLILGSPCLAREESTLTCAISAMISPKETFVYYQKLVDYISKRMGEKILMKQRRTYEEVNRMLQIGDVDFALICTGAFVDGKKEFGLSPIVVPIVRGEPYYHSYIIVHHDRPFPQFQDLKGKSFAFNDPLSLTGRVFPLYLLQKMGFSPKTFFSQTIYTYSHDNSIEAVANEVVDGAAVDSLVWDFFQARSVHLVLQTRVLMKSPPFGIPPVVISTKLPPKLREKLKGVFLEMEKNLEGREILEVLKIDRFILPPPHLYDSAIEMKRFIQSSLAK